MKRLFLIPILAAAVTTALGQYGKAVERARIADGRIQESSGLAASPSQPGVLWTHNDSGAPPLLFAFDAASGRGLGAWRVEGASNVDWEDMASAPDGRLYIGDIGDNSRSRKEVVVYRVAEPKVNGRDGVTAPAEALRFRYPDGAHDAEAMFVHPRSGDLYIVTKAREGDPRTLVFRAVAPLRSSGKAAMLRLAAEVRFPNDSEFTLMLGRVTGAAISPDGRRVAVSTYFRGWEWVLPADATGFDAIWKTTPKEVDLGKRPQGESVAYRSDGKALLAASEGANPVLWESARH